MCGVCPPARADEVRGEPGVVFNLFSAPAMSINAAFEAVPLRFRALDITDTTLGSVDLAACAERQGGFLWQVRWAEYTTHDFLCDALCLSPSLRS